MGDRANVYIHNGVEPGVYLYTHWSGSDLPAVVRVALGKQWRWQDTAYLGRIIFCEMIKGDEAAETGFGISAQVGDGSSRIVDVDTATQRVTVGPNSWLFVDYIKLRRRK